MRLDQLADILKSLTLPVIQAETQEVILSDKEILNRKKSELKAGVNPDGSIIGEYASEEYALFKRRLNPVAGGKVDLILTGATKNDLKVEALGNGMFRIYSTDPKWKGLVAKYDEQRENLEIINQEVFLGLQKTKHGPELIDRLKAKTGL